MMMGHGGDFPEVVRPTECSMLYAEGIHVLSVIRSVLTHNYVRLLALTSGTCKNNETHQE